MAVYVSMHACMRVLPCLTPSGVICHFGPMPRTTPHLLPSYNHLLQCLPVALPVVATDAERQAAAAQLAFVQQQRAALAASTAAPTAQGTSQTSRGQRKFGLPQTARTSLNARHKKQWLPDTDSDAENVRDMVRMQRPACPHCLYHVRVCGTLDLALNPFTPLPVLFPHVHTHTVHTHTVHTHCTHLHVVCAPRSPRSCHDDLG